MNFFSGDGVRLLLVRHPGGRPPVHPGPRHPPSLRPPHDRLRDFQALRQRRQVDITTLFTGNIGTMCKPI